MIRIQKRLQKSFLPPRSFGYSSEGRTFVEPPGCAVAPPRGPIVRSANRRQSLAVISLKPELTGPSMGLGVFTWRERILREAAFSIKRACRQGTPKIRVYLK